MSALKNTPLRDFHLELGAKMVPFSGWNMPVQYPGGILAEHRHTRTACSVFDICHMGEFRISGPGCATALDLALARPVSDLAVGSCRYNLLLEATGGVLDDLIVYRMEPEDFFIVVNAGNIDSDAAVFRERLPEQVDFSDLSERLAKLDLQGPRSAEVLGRLGLEAAGLPRYYHWNFQELDGIRCIVSRTGYTGELGFELYFDAEYADELWTLLLETDPVRPAGLGARDTLRLEMGYALYGHELRREWTPLDCSLQGLIRLEGDRDFIGRSALIAQKSPRRAVAVRLDGRRAARAGAAVFDAAGREIGVVTSGAFGPSLGAACALCNLESGPELAPGTLLELAAGSDRLPARVTPLPLVKDTSLRAKI